MMGAFIAKQPNGLYCRFSTVTDCPTNWNMTEDDYVKLCEQKAREEALDTLSNYVHPFDEVKRWYRSRNMTLSEFDKFLREVSESNAKV